MQWFQQRFKLQARKEKTSVFKCFLQPGESLVLFIEACIDNGKITAIYSDNKTPPGLAPGASAGDATAGCHTLWSYSRVPPQLNGGWAPYREMFADRIEERIERLAPGFRAIIRARAIHAPLILIQLPARQN